ncbi:MAG: anion transporter [Anaerolineales bacterium]|jgi:Na+/H+ antiporter NhaD/arsenite permease-like protein
MTLASELAIPVIALTYIGVALGEFPGLKTNRATIALGGAVLLLGLQVLTPRAALQSIDLNTLLLLLAMMIISAHLRLAGFFSWMGQLVARRTRSSRLMLAWVIAVPGVLAAVFMNDTVVLVFTPLVVDLAHTMRRDPLPYLLGLTTAANIGSAAAMTGNPQNILIGSSSHIPFNVFLAKLGPISLIGLALSWVILLWLYRGEFDRPWEGPAEVLTSGHVDTTSLRRSLILVGLMVVAFVAGIPVAAAAVAVAAAFLVSRRARLEVVFAQVDWSVLVFFLGLFVVTGALERIRLVDQVVALIEPFARAGVWPFAVAVALLSNLVSNVPAVLLVRPLVSQLANPVQAWLTLAMASTLAGNLTLVGSAANLIVAEVSRAQGVRISFREYLRAGVPITLMTIVVGVLWLSLVA